MDDVADQQDIANEISEAISNPVGFGQDVDDVRGLPAINDEICLRPISNPLVQITGVNKSFQ